MVHNPFFLLQKHNVHAMLWLAQRRAEHLHTFTSLLSRMYTNVVNCFALQEHNVHDMLWLAQRRAEYLQLMGPKVHDMLTFVENHDLPRWLHTNYSSVTRYQ